MDKYIGFDIDNKKTVACVAQKGGKTSYEQQPGKPLLIAGIKLQGNTRRAIHVSTRFIKLQEIPNVMEPDT